MKKIIVSGASGFIGRHAVKALGDRNFEVHALVHNQKLQCDGVIEHPIDLLNDEKKMSALVSEIGASHLLHLAWAVEPGQFWNSPKNLDWVALSLKLYRAFANAGGKRVVVSGTCAEYDWKNLTEKSTLDEIESPQVPSTLYGVSKLSLFQMLSRAAVLDKISFAWGRIFFLYGAGEKSGRLISDAIKSLLQKKPFACSAGTQIRDFMNVQDVGYAFAALCDHSLEGPVNIGTGEANRLVDVLKEIEKQLGSDGLLQFGKIPMPPNEPVSIVAKVDRLRKVWPELPKNSLQLGIKDSIQWHQANI